jgi:hypothetical protein
MTRQPRCGAVRAGVANRTKGAPGANLDAGSIVKKAKPRQSLGKAGRVSPKLGLRLSGR